MDRLVGEMAGLLSDAYFHIGGDEVNGRQWKQSPTIQAFIKQRGLTDKARLQTYFNQRVLLILRKHGKQMMGWDEILHQDLPKDIMVESWQNHESLAVAAQRGYKGLLSFGYYLDHLKSAGEYYVVDPVGGPAATLTAEQKQNILGGEACMWTEFISPETIDSRMWPKSAAVAERLWSASELTDVADMYMRLDVVSHRLTFAGRGMRRTTSPCCGGLLRRRPWRRCGRSPTPWIRRASSTGGVSALHPGDGIESNGRRGAGRQRASANTGGGCARVAANANRRAGGGDSTGTRSMAGQRCAAGAIWPHEFSLARVPAVVPGVGATGHRWTGGDGTLGCAARRRSVGTEASGSTRTHSPCSPGSTNGGGAPSAAVGGGCQPVTKFDGGIEGRKPHGDYRAPSESHFKRLQPQEQFVLVQITHDAAGHIEVNNEKQHGPPQRRISRSEPLRCVAHPHVHQVPGQRVLP